MSASKHFIFASLFIALVTYSVYVTYVLRSTIPDPGPRLSVSLAPLDCDGVDCPARYASGSTGALLGAFELHSESTTPLSLEHVRIAFQGTSDRGNISWVHIRLVDRSVASPFESGRVELDASALSAAFDLSDFPPELAPGRSYTMSIYGNVWSVSCCNAANVALDSPEDLVATDPAGRHAAVSFERKDPFASPSFILGKPVSRTQRYRDDTLCASFEYDTGTSELEPHESSSTTGIGYSLWIRGPDDIIWLSLASWTTPENLWAARPVDGSEFRAVSLPSGLASPTPAFAGLGDGYYGTHGGRAYLFTASTELSDGLDRLLDTLKFDDCKSSAES